MNRKCMTVTNRSDCGLIDTEVGVDDTTYERKLLSEPVIVEEFIDNQSKSANIESLK